jgi:predicted permease
VRSVDALRRGDPGFQTTSIITARISPPGRAYKDSTLVTRFYDDLLNRTVAIPGIERAAIVSELPFATGYGGAYRIAGQFEDITGKTSPLPTSDHSLVVSPSYFATLGIPILSGRAFTSGDRADALPVAIVSESFAKHFWPNTSAIGQRIGYPWQSPWITIVGVVRDAKLDSLTGTNEQTIYRPHAQRPLVPMSIVARTRSDRLAFATPLRAAVAQIDATVPVSDVRTMEEVAASTQARPRFTMVLLTIFAGVALLLGVVGIYGLMSYSVAQRQREVGIRMALGASPGDARRMVLGEGMRLAAIGIGIGLVAALSTTRLLSGFLYGVTSTDPLTFALATLTLAVVALASSYIPALRATKVDPTTALRAE